MTGGDRASSSKVRDQVLSFMRARGGVSRRVERTEAAGAAPPSFADLPEYKQLVAQTEASRLTGVGNPFYKMHEGIVGATTVIDGRELVNFASYDYLGLNRHHVIAAAATEAIQRFGLSASASRVVAGERSVHGELERSIADVYGTEAAVAFVSGYLTNVAAIDAIVGPQDLVIHDELIHNSALAGMRLSGAHRRFFRHNDLADLDAILSASRADYRRALVIVEGLYSMDGDVADLPGLIELRKRHGFWLMVDDAHALGVLGDTGRGTFEHFGCDPRDVDIWMGTLSKTTASCGGYVAGTTALATLMKGAAGGFVYSVGLAPVLAASAAAALDVIRDEPERVHRLRENGALFLKCARSRGLDTGPSIGRSVIPVMVGDSLRAVRLSNDLAEAGVNAMPIIHPAVPEGQARLRFFITSDHTSEQIEFSVRTTAEKLEALKASNFGIASVDVGSLLKALGES